MFENKFFREGEIFPRGISVISGGVEMFSKVVVIILGMVRIISVVLSLFRGIERFPGGRGEIFSG